MTLFVFVPGLYGEIPEYCSIIDDEIICEISIFQVRVPLPDYTPDIAVIPNDAKVIFPIKMMVS